MDKKRKPLDFITALVFIALSIYMISESIRFHSVVDARIATPFIRSPGFFPMIIGVGMLLCSLLLLVRSLRGIAFREIIQNIIETAITIVKSPVTFKAVIGCSWMGAYIFVLLPHLGFVSGSILFLVVLMIFLQYKEWMNSGAKVIIKKLARYLVTSAVSVGLTAAVFNGIFGVPLP